MTGLADGGPRPVAEASAEAAALRMDGSVLAADLDEQQASAPRPPVPPCSLWEVGDSPAGTVKRA
eukprot:3519371-Prymnesium_polylepis.1